MACSRRTAVCLYGRQLQKMPEQAIKILVGLGNPGPEHHNTRHNAGFWFIDWIAQQNNCHLSLETKFHGYYGQLHLDGLQLKLLKPLTYVNRSGQAVAACALYFKLLPSQILVIHDELDLPPGQVRLKLGGGHAGHNGLRDITQALGTAEFWRIRIGIGHPGDRKRVVDYVLGCPESDQIYAIDNALERIALQLPKIITGQFDQVMNQLHKAVVLN